MAENDDQQEQPEEKKNQPGEDPKVPVEVRTYFVRERNALLARAEFPQLYIDYYLHLMQHSIQHDDQSDSVLKDALAALTLHLASRPQDESTAWTISIREPLVNLFVAGNSRTQNIVGRLFEPEGKRDDVNLLSSQITSSQTDLRQSTIDFSEGDIFRGAEAYYKQSEQRPARYFQLGEEEFAMVTAQPDCDIEWLNELEDEDLVLIDKTETLSLLERRFYLFDCGCELKRILDLFSPYDKEALDGLFDEDVHLVIACPRCAARFQVSREQIDEHIGRAGK